MSGRRGRERAACAERASRYEHRQLVTPLNTPIGLQCSPRPRGAQGSRRGNAALPPVSSGARHRRREDVMSDKKQNEHQDELRDLDVPMKDAEGVKGGKMHLEDVSLGVVAKRPGQAGPKPLGGSS